jgi:hypothetical protein
MICNVSLGAFQVGDAKASTPFSEMKLKTQSFSLISAARHLGLRASRDLVIWGSIGMLAMRLEALVVAAVWMVVAMLRSPILVHIMLLRTCARNKLLVRSRVSSSHWHYSNVSYIHLSKA